MDVCVRDKSIYQTEIEILDSRVATTRNISTAFDFSNRWRLNFNILNVLYISYIGYIANHFSFSNCCKHRQTNVAIYLLWNNNEIVVSVQHKGWISYMEDP